MNPEVEDSESSENQRQLTFYYLESEKTYPFSIKTALGADPIWL